MRADLTERLAATVYHQGEAKQKAGDTAGAVDDFLRVSRVAPDVEDPPHRPQYDAAAQLINLKQWDRAIGVLEDFRREFPAESAAAGGHAQARRLLLRGQPPGRGEWASIVIPLSGLFSFHREEKKNGWFRNYKAKPGDPFPTEYDFSKAPKLKVPGDCDTQRQSLMF